MWKTWLCPSHALSESDGKKQTTGTILCSGYECSLLNHKIRSSSAPCQLPLHDKKSDKEIWHSGNKKHMDKTMTKNIGKNDIAIDICQKNTISENICVYSLFLILQWIYIWKLYLGYMNNYKTSEVATWSYPWHLSSMFTGETPRMKLDLARITELL